MNLSAIKSACFGGKHATIYNAVRGIGRGQWISNGFGAYLVEGIEIGSEAALMELWNLSDKARAKAVIMMSPVSDRRFTVDFFPGEEELKELGAVAWGENSVYIGLESLHGVLWIDAALLKPMRKEYLRFFARWVDGRPLVAVYEDMTYCKALILPTGDEMARQLNAMAKALTAPVYRWPDAERDAAEAEEAAEALIRGDGGEDEPGGD